MKKAGISGSASITDIEVFVRSGDNILAAPKVSRFKNHLAVRMPKTRFLETGE